MVRHCDSLLLICFVGVALAPVCAAAQEPAVEEREADSSNLWPVVAALVPGLVVHGSGHLVAGRSDEGLSLLAMQGVGLGAIGVGVVPMFATGASRKISGLSIAVVGAGAGLVAISGLADLFGVVTGGTNLGPRDLPGVEADVGYRFVYDPQFEYRNFAKLQATGRLGDWRLSVSSWLAMDDDNQRNRLEAGYRLLGFGAGESGVDGSALDLRTALVHHNYGTEGFYVLTFETEVAGRYDMRRFASTLRGSFAEMSAGWAMETYTYDVEGLGFGEDTAELLLFRFAYGVYLPGAATGEWTIYYDHRHDDFAAGLGVKGIGGGPAGHFGTEALVHVTRRWALSAEGQVGSAYVSGIGVRYVY